MTGLNRVARMLAVLLLGLMAGFFYAFSVTVMPGLDRVDPATAIDAMNGINAAVRNPVFFFTFFVTPFIAILGAAMSMIRGERRAGWTCGAAAILYLLGVIAPTAAVNVPMNQALALFVFEAAANPLDMVWSDYSSRWTQWNTLRGSVSAVCMVLAALSLIPTGNRRALS